MSRRSTKAYRWYYIWPGMSVAYDIRFERPVTEREAREAIREHWGFRRLPRGTQIWPASYANPISREGAVVLIPMAILMSSVVFLVSAIVYMNKQEQKKKQKEEPIYRIQLVRSARQ